MLSPLLYYIKNKGKGLLLLFTLVACVFGVTFVSTIISSISETCKPLGIYPYENFSFISCLDSNNIDTDKEITEELKSSECYRVYQTSFDFKLITVTTNAMILSFDENTDIESIMEKCNLKLVDGQLPKRGKYEIIVHENILKNQNLKIGDEFKKFKITGSVSGKSVIALGYIDMEEFEEYFAKVHSYIVFNDNSEKAKNEINSISTDKWRVYDIEKAQNELDDSFSDLNVILAISIIMLTISISIAISALVFSQYSSRYDEFAIMNAIGYKKKSVILMIVTEIIIVAVVGWAIGYSLALLGAYIVDVNVYQDTGQTMRIFNKGALRYSFVPLICSIVFTLIPTIRKLAKTDLISIIERRY